MQPIESKEIISFVSPILDLGIFELLSEYLGIKGQINLEQFLFGKDTMGLGDKSSVEVTKPKLYNAMNVDPTPTQVKSLRMVKVYI